MQVDPIGLASAAQRIADVLRREAANFTSADELNAERLRL